MKAPDYLIGWKIVDPLLFDILPYGLSWITDKNTTKNVEIIHEIHQLLQYKHKNPN